PLTSAQGTPWQTFYGKQPDFAFILPNKYSGYNTNYTPDIQFSSATAPTAQSPVTITATVRNFSLAGYTGASGPVQVPFYDGDQTNGGTRIDTGQAKITSLLNQAPQDLTQSFTPPAAGCYPIWVVIDPGNQLPEIHKANNQGWSDLAVFPAGSDGT